MKQLSITWQRLVNEEGKTCDRCGATYQEMQRALSKLTEVLRPLGIEPRLEIKEIDKRSFLENPSESNRIWIEGKSIEQWLGATVGSSRCCSVCGDSSCRTVELGSATYEVIPEALILQAAMLAASQLLNPEASASSCAGGSSCCVS